MRNCSHWSRRIVSVDPVEDPSVPAADVTDDDVLAVAEAMVASRDPLTDDAGRLRLSFTRISTFEQCPWKFRAQYVDGIPSRPAPQLSFGTSIHAVLEWLYDRKHPELPSLEETLQALYERWDTTGYAEVERDEQLTAYRHARDVITAFHGRVLREGFRLPAATEAWFEVPFEGDVVVVGAIDRLDVDADGGLHVVDYKTNRRAKRRSDVAGSLQLALYALATRELYGALPRTVALDFVVPGVQVAVGVEELDLDRVPGRVADVAARIRAGESAATPNRLCDWCDVRGICPAWDADSDPVVGLATRERDELRRRITRDVRRLQQLEASLDRLSPRAAAVTDDA
jgi:putative RecB family exonuclease